MRRNNYYHHEYFADQDEWKRRGWLAIWMTQLRNRINPFDKKKRMQVQNQNVTQEKNPSPSQQKAEINAPAMQNASQSLAGKKNSVAEIQGDGISKDKTSKYLKVLSRIEGLLVKDALPEAAV